MGLPQTFRQLVVADELTTTSNNEGGAMKGEKKVGLQQIAMSVLAFILIVAVGTQPSLAADERRHV
ncbi:MAG: hypothetical protein PVG74_23545 [Desulfobacterales bacterium]|jgi:membrane protease subunit (stomatin/prohibitin family)